MVLDIIFGDNYRTLFVDKGDGIQIKYINLARKKFKKMDREYRKELISLIDSRTNKLLSRGINKILTENQ